MPVAAHPIESEVTVTTWRASTMDPAEFPRFLEKPSRPHRTRLHWLLMLPPRAVSNSRFCLFPFLASLEGFQVMT